MTCPVCLSSLQTIARDCHICPKGDGVALSGSQLMTQDSNIVAKVDEKDDYRPEADRRTHTILCPDCGTAMERVDYCNSGIFIDSCTASGCHLRWLDGDEFSKIKNRKAKLSTSDILALSQLEIKTNALKSRPNVDNNPALPVTFHLLRSQSDPYAQIAQLSIALITLIKGLVYSPFLRFVGIGFFIIMATIGYFILRQIESAF